MSHGSSNVGSLGRKVSSGERKLGSGLPKHDFCKSHGGAEMWSVCETECRTEMKGNGKGDYEGARRTRRGEGEGVGGFWGAMLLDIRRKGKADVLASRRRDSQGSQREMGNGCTWVNSPLSSAQPFRGFRFNPVTTSRWQPACAHASLAVPTHEIPRNSRHLCGCTLSIRRSSRRC